MLNPNYNVGDIFEDELTIESSYHRRSAVGFILSGMTGNHTIALNPFEYILKTCIIENGKILGRKKWRYYKQGTYIGIKLD